LTNIYEGISTFYLAPKDTKDTNAEMAVRLGLALPGQTLNPVPALRNISAYHQREVDAIENLKDFKVILIC
jgi:hypothetical protein